MKIRYLGVFGTSGFAREVADIGAELGYTPFYVARNENDESPFIDRKQVVLESELGAWADADFAIGIGENIARQKVAERYRDKLRFINLVHPTASFGQGQLDLIRQKTGVVVCAGVRFTNNILVGDFNIFNLNCTIGHDVVIDDYVNVSPGVNISGNVHLGARCWLGTGSAINQGDNARKLSIGADTVIGSGSVVVKDCEHGAVYVGIPAKRLK